MKKWSLRTAHFLPDLSPNDYFTHGWGHKRQISVVRLVRKKILYNFLKFCWAAPWPVMSQQMLTRRKNMRLESGNNQSKWTPGMPQSLHSFAWWLNLPGAWFYADVDGNFYEMQPIFLRNTTHATSCYTTLCLFVESPCFINFRHLVLGFPTLHRDNLHIYVLIATAIVPVLLCKVKQRKFKTRWQKRSIS